MGITASFQGISQKLLDRLIIEPRMMGAIVYLPEAFDFYVNARHHFGISDDISWVNVYRQVKIDKIKNSLSLSEAQENINRFSIVDVADFYESIEIIKEQAIRLGKLFILDELEYLLQTILEFEILERDGFSPEDSSDGIDIGKDWHELCPMLRSKLNQNDEDLEYVILGKNKINYGSDLIKYLDVNQTSQAAESLAKITFENVIERGCIGGVVDIVPFAYGGIRRVY